MHHTSFIRKVCRHSNTTKYFSSPTSERGNEPKKAACLFVLFCSKDLVVEDKTGLAVPHCASPQNTDNKRNSMKSFASSNITAVIVMLSSALLCSSRRGVVMAFSRTSSFTGGPASLTTSSMKRTYSSTTLSMKLQTAIVGLPNVGTYSYSYAV